MTKLDRNRIVVTGGKLAAGANVYIGIKSDGLPDLVNAVIGLDVRINNGDTTIGPGGGFMFPLASFGSNVIDVPLNYSREVLSVWRKSCNPQPGETVFNEMNFLSGLAELAFVKSFVLIGIELGYNIEDQFIIKRLEISFKHSVYRVDEYYLTKDAVPVERFFVR